MSNLTRKEEVLWAKLQECQHDKAKWITVLYLLVTKFGTDFKLVIPDVDQYQVPDLDNPIEWNFDKETKTLTLEIKEKEEEPLILSIEKDTEIILP